MKTKKLELTKNKRGRDLRSYRFGKRKNFLKKLSEEEIIKSRRAFSFFFLKRVQLLLSEVLQKRIE